jgi:hypothetical protein
LKETKNDAPKIPAGNSMDQKTNEDFNKKKPDPTDPNQQKGQHQRPILMRMAPNLPCQDIQA